MDNLLACMPSYDSFFSFYRRVPLKGIHGTAIFTKKSTVVPIKAEEGIGSCLIPSTLEPAERIGGYPQSLDVDLAFHEMKDLDMEGRTTVCDLGMFVIINLYCPNETNDDRLVFKNYFNAMVDARVRSLIKAGREVIVVGDLNICHSPLDSAESEVRRKEQGLENFIDHPPRKWLNEFVGPNGPMIDITRRLHPARKQMYTCWNTKIDARPSNYGTRLDYLLITPGLLPWVRDADILPLVMGSDHCPAYVNFYDQIEIPGRGMVHIWDELNPGRSRDDLSPPEPPAFAAKNYDEFSGKQKLLPSFFGKRLEGELGETPSSSAPARTSGKRVIDNSVPSFTVSNLPVASGSSVEFEFSRQPTTTSAKRKSASAPPATKVGSSSAPSVKGKEKAPATGQQSIASFFKPPPKPKAIPKKKKKKDIAAPTSPTASPTLSTPTLSSSQEVAHPTSHASTSASQSSNSLAKNLNDPPPDTFDVGDFEVAASTSAAWSTLFTPKALPMCDGHNEPSKLWTVNKPGLNKGRRFYLCSRPVGPGYDKGQAKTHVNKEWRCNFFEWETNVRRPAAGGAVAQPNKRQKI